MNVLYLLPILPPKIPQAEALYQEIDLLRRHHPGRLIYINPNQHLRLPVRLPRLLFGWQLLAKLRQWAQGCDVCHFYNPDPFAYPILSYLRKPVVYSLSGGLSQTWNRRYFARLGAITTLSQADQAHMQQQGLRNVFLVRPSVDAQRFTQQPQPLVAQSPIRLMMASAPWTHSQFQSKGVDALLTAAQRNPRLHITFLWRGHLLPEMQQRLAQANLKSQISIIDGAVDVNAILATVHASVVLAEGSQIIKAYPQSLLDSLAAGKPVLLSRSIPMSDYVGQTGCGEIIDSVTPEAILASVAALEANYARYATVSQTAAHDFAPEQTVASFTAAYEFARA